MTMHMLPAYYTTTNTKRKKKKAQKPNPEHEKFLRKHGVHPDQLGSRRTMRAQKRTQSVTNTAGAPQMTVNTSCQRFTSDKIPVGVAVKPEPNIYSGKRKLLGIAAMHKSNLVPVFGEDDAKEIARMRRG
tara:strand:- start:282 stop:671 length:390 start_codon:yes stop_codon:yes gene_type:complete